MRFDEDIGKDETEEEKVKPKKNKRWQKSQEVPKQLPVNDKKKTRQELISKAREEVTSDKSIRNYLLEGSVNSCNHFHCIFFRLMQILEQFPSVLIRKREKGYKKKHFLLCLKLIFAF